MMPKEAMAVWREGMVPHLSTAALEALARGLQRDDPTLLQGATTSPTPLLCVQDWPVEAACPLGYCGWMGGDARTVTEAEEYFARRCWEADQEVREPAACRWFLNWWDDTPRKEAVADLLEEVRLALAHRAALGGREAVA